MESSEANMSPQEKYLATSGVIEELSTAIQSLFSREQLPENPYAALAASSVATAASGRRRVSTVIDACGLTQSIVPYGGRRYPCGGGLSL